MGAIFPYAPAVGGTAWSGYQNTDYQIGAWGFFKKVGKIAKGAVRTVARSKFLKTTVAGVAMVYPPAGAAGAAVIGAAVAADTVIAAAERGNKNAKSLIKNTKAAANMGDRQAQRSVRIMNKRAAARKRLPGHLRGKPVLNAATLAHKTGTLGVTFKGAMVLPGGQKVIGHFKRIS